MFFVINNMTLWLFLLSNLEQLFMLCQWLVVEQLCRIIQLGFHESHIDVNSNYCLHCTYIPFTEHASNYRKCLSSAQCNTNSSSRQLQQTHALQQSVLSTWIVPLAITNTTIACKMVRLRLRSTAMNIKSLQHPLPWRARPVQTDNTTVQVKMLRNNVWNNIVSAGRLDGRSVGCGAVCCSEVSV